jgi:hypothetical protein
MVPVIATAIAATITEPSGFRSGREFAAWLGLVPRQNSTGGKVRLGGISVTGPVWDWPSAARPSNATTAAYGQPAIRHAAQSFISCYGHRGSQHTDDARSYCHRVAQLITAGSGTPAGTRKARVLYRSCAGYVIDPLLAAAGVVSIEVSKLRRLRLRK